MALGMPTESGGGGEFSAIVKYDARAGRMFRVDRTQDGGGAWNTDNVEITQGFQAIMDLENIEVGWALFAAGAPPSFAMVKLGEPMPARPTSEHRNAFRLMMKLGKSVGGDVRELAAQAKTVIGAVDKLHDAYTAGLKDNPGKLPVVALTGAVPVTSTGQGKSSTNYAPVFEITAWVDRPAELSGQPGQRAGTTDALPASEPVATPAPAQPARAEPALAGQEF